MKRSKKNESVKNRLIAMGSDLVQLPESVPLLIEYGDGIELFARKDCESRAKTVLNSIRQHIAEKYGFVMPAFSLRLNSSLKPDIYRLVIHGGIVCPFGKLEAKDCDAIIEKRLISLISNHLHDIFDLAALESLIEQAKKEHGYIVEEATAVLMGMAPLISLFKSILEEKISIRRVDAILAAVAGQSRISCTTHCLFTAARSAIGRQICSPFLDNFGVLNVISLDPSVENDLNQKIIDEDQKSQFNCTLDYALKLQETIGNAVDNFTNTGNRPVLLVGDKIRGPLRQLSQRKIPDLTVLGYSDIPVDYPLNAHFIISDLKPDTVRLSGKDAKEIYDQAKKNSKSVK
ncbi:MAG TPA: FHIPEP family type III secretion protein [Candidatus Rifleibacterium sp.]|nr:FHIPEP family type III secretion protein [Candidatus Rifleibacterium sp.]